MAECCYWIAAQTLLAGFFDQGSLKVKNLQLHSPDKITREQSSGYTQEHEVRRLIAATCDVGLGQSLEVHEHGRGGLRHAEPHGGRVRSRTLSFFQSFPLLVGGLFLRRSRALC